MWLFPPRGHSDSHKVHPNHQSLRGNIQNGDGRPSCSAHQHVELVTCRIYTSAQTLTRPDSTSHSHPGSPDKKELRMPNLKFSSLISFLKYLLKPNYRSYFLIKNMSILPGVSVLYICVASGQQFLTMYPTHTLSPSLTFLHFYA